VKFYCFLHWFEDQSKVVGGVSNVVTNFPLNTEEVVVVGYGKRQKVVQSSKVVSNSAMENLTVLSPQQMLRVKLRVYKLFSHQVC
jgi:hypothetical protein